MEKATSDSVTNATQKEAARRKNAAGHSESRAQAQARAAALLTAGTLASRLLGLARDLLTACLLGPAADAFVLAFRLPNFFRRLLAEGSLGMAFAAAEARIRADHGAAEAQRFARSVCLRVFLLALPLCLPLLPLAPLLTLALAPGAHQETIYRSAALFRLCLPYLPLSLMAALAFTHAINTRRFLPQAWGPAVFNIPILCCGLAALLLQPGTRGIENALCLGVIFGGLAQAILGLRCLYSAASFKVRPGPRSQQQTKRSGALANVFSKAGLLSTLFGPPPVRTLLRSLLPSALGAAPHQLHNLAGMLLASFLAPGGISALYFAERLVELPLGLAGAAVGIAALPSFAALGATGKAHELTETLGRSMRMGAFLSLPATAGLFALALPLSALIFGHGAFTGESVSITASALRGYAIALPALCASRPLLGAINALQQERLPIKTIAYSTAVLLLVSTGAILLSTKPEEAALGIGIGLTAGAWCNLLLLLRGLYAILQKDAEPTNAWRAGLGGVLRGICGYAAVAALMGICLSYAAAALTDTTLPLLGVICLCTMAWFGLFLFIGTEDARAFAALAGKKS